MNRLARIIITRSKLIITATILLNFLAVVSFSRASLDASIFSVFKTGEEYTENFFHLSEKYGGTDTVLIVVTAENEITSKENLISFWSYFEPGWAGK